MLWHTLLIAPRDLPPPSPVRKGASSRAAIRPMILHDLNAGLIETVTLSEWLAIDQPALVAAALTSVGLSEHAEKMSRLARSHRSLPFTKRLKASAGDLYRLLSSHPRGPDVAAALARHESDMVRSWVAYAIACDESLDLLDRLRLAERFAADRTMSVRECAWDSYRPHLTRDLHRGLALLEPWTRHEDANVRRCAIESTRPRGVWTSHIEALKENPSLAACLLEPVRSDESRYVRVAVGNWLNDAGKSQPDWVRALCERWSGESPTPETAWIVRHALRTIGRERPATPKRSGDNTRRRT
jgi:3-methyladenine DNA glycosylase AlkC